MAHVYDSFRQYLAVGSADLGSVTLKAALVNTLANANSGYVFSAAHTTLADVPQVAIQTTATLAGVAVSSGRVDANDLAIATVTGGDINGIILYVSTADSSTSPLMFIQSEGTGFPLTPDGGTVNVTWASSDPFIMKV